MAKSDLGRVWWLGLINLGEYFTSNGKPGSGTKQPTGWNGQEAEVELLVHSSLYCTCSFSELGSKSSVRTKYVIEKVSRIAILRLKTVAYSFSNNIPNLSKAVSWMIFLMCTLPWSLPVAPVPAVGESFELSSAHDLQGSQTQSNIVTK